MNPKKTISEEIKDHFRVIGVEPGEIRLASGEIVDLSTISLEKANELHEAGFEYLEKIISDNNITKSDSAPAENLSAPDEKDSAPAGSNKNARPNRR